jgi:haloalkane dehalogenase
MASRLDRTSSLDWRRLYPFESRWFQLASGFGRMHYVDEGPEFRGRESFSTGDVASAIEIQIESRPIAPTPAPTLLFVHGNPTWSFHWRRLVVALRDRYRCVAPDHIGCGLSEKPPRYLRLDERIDHLATLVTTLDLTNVTLIAQDWGGAIGLGAMLRMPERLERIVLFNTGAFPPRYIPRRIRACQIPLLGRLAVQGANHFSRAALRMTLARRQALEPAVAAGYLAPYDSWANRSAVYGFVRDIPNGPEHPTWRALGQIERKLPMFAELPVLLVWGMRDWCFRPDCLERFLAAWPDAEVHPLPDVGHWVVEDAPDESLAIVEQFLASRCREPSGTR